MTRKDKVNQYIKDIQQGNIPVRLFVKQAVARYLSDIEQGPQRGIYFDEAAAQHAIQFFEEYLFHSTGKWAGQAFILEPWQAFIVWNLFGFKRQDGSRRFRIAYTEIARKNGKSTLAAGIGLYCLVADKESRAEVYSAATKKDQARIVFNEAKRMVRVSADLRKYAKPMAHVITLPQTFSKFEPLGADSDTMDGLNVHCAVIDELHAHKSRELWDVLLTATGARRQPLIFAISTAGFDKSEASICWIQHEYAANLLKGEIQDDSYLAYIATLDDGDDWLNETLWAKSNPNLGVSLQTDDLREEARRAQRAPTSLNPFLRYKLNVWTSSDKSWLTEEQWGACNKGEIDPAALEGRACYLGLDLAKKVDTSAVVAVFPPEQAGGDFIILPYVFLPGETLADRERSERIPWLDWHNRGFVHTSPGKVIETVDILAIIESLDRRYDVKDIVYDRWRAPDILPDLESMGWASDTKDQYATRYLIEMGQGFKDMSPAIRTLEETVTAAQLNHGGNPVLAYMVQCVSILEDDAGNVKFSKKKSKGKIDAVVALAMALFRAKIHPVTQVSVYEERGPRFITL